jgi:hypothetical protein
MNTLASQSKSFSNASCRRKTRRKVIPVGKIFSTNYGPCEVIAYRCATHVSVRFVETDSLVVCRAYDLRNGHVKDPLRPSVWGVGFTAGETTVDAEGTHLLAYTRWKSLLQRVQTRPEYAGVVLGDFANFSIFKSWWQEHTEGLTSETIRNLAVDKDLFAFAHKTKKIYSSSTCVLLSSETNRALSKLELIYRDVAQLVEGEIPRGVQRNQSLYQVQITHQGADYYCGSFNSLANAIQRMLSARTRIFKNAALADPMLTPSARLLIDKL